MKKYLSDSSINAVVGLLQENVAEILNTGEEAIEILSVDFLIRVIVTAVLLIVVTIFIRRVYNRYLIKKLSPRWFKERSLKTSERLILLFIYLASILALFSQVEPFKSGIGYFFRILPSELFLIIIIVVVAFLLTTILKIVFKSYIRVKNADQETAIRVTGQIVIAMVFIVALAAILNVLGLGGTVTGIIMGAGFAGIVIGLAAQGVLGNFFSGLSILFSRPYRIGDAVLYHDNFTFVEDITLMHTVLRTWDNKRVIVPNSVIDKEPLINYTINDPTMIAPIYIDVAYETDMEKAYRVMVEEAKKHPLCLTDKMEPKVHLTGFKDSGIELRLIAFARTQGDAFQMSCDLRRSMLERFREENIEIPYPKRYIIHEKKTE